MSDSDHNLSSENNERTLPTNEELIENLTSDFKKSLIKDEIPVQTNDSNKILEHAASLEDNFVENNNPSSSEINHTLPTSCQEDEPLVEEKDPNSLSIEDDSIDELALKDREVTYSEEDKVRLRKEAEDLKQNGNQLFKEGQYRESAQQYTQGLRICPLAYGKDRAILYSNRAAAKMKLGLNESAIEDCSMSLELEERYLKALFRRAQLYEATDKLDEALADYNKILEVDPLHRDALHASKRLPDQIQERNEKLKTEMLGKLKDLGNMFLKPFGLSTENFQLNQDPNSGGYSVNFKN